MNEFHDDLNDLSVTDIHTFMDTIKSNNNSVKQFTTSDLRKHISGHWHFQMRVQMDTGSSDCITNDKNVLKHNRNV